MKTESLVDVNLVWYVVAALPIGALFYLSATGVLPALLLLLSFFLALFWLFSFGFALYVMWRRRRAAK